MRSRRRALAAGVRVVVQAPIRPTEDAAKVEAAVRALFPEAVGKANRERLDMEATGLDALRRRIWELRIIDSVRGALLPGAGPDGVRFRLSKQAAAAGRVALPVGKAPLGEIEVSVRLEPGDRWKDGEALAWWLCPETQDGQIVGPTD